MTAPIKIDYYTDILCIWAWVSQLHIAQLKEEFGDDVHISHIYMDVFGDVQHKMNTTWKSKNGFDGFSKHIQHTASLFPNLKIKSDLWLNNQPLTSANAHLYIKAVQLSLGINEAERFALKVREAFFITGRNIADINMLNLLVTEQDYELPVILTYINNGQAMASLMKNYQDTKQLGLSGSPTFILDDGRQTLYGNISYDVLKANVSALMLKH